MVMVYEGVIARRVTPTRRRILRRDLACDDGTDACRFGVRLPRPRRNVVGNEIGVP